MEDESAILYHAEYIASHISPIRRNCDELINFIRDKNLSGVFQDLYLDLIRWEGELGEMELGFNDMHKLKVKAESAEIIEFPFLEADIKGGITK